MPTTMRDAHEQGDHYRYPRPRCPLCTPETKLDAARHEGESALGSMRMRELLEIYDGPRNARILMSRVLPLGTVPS